MKKHTAYNCVCHVLEDGTRQPCIARGLTAKGRTRAVRTPLAASCVWHVLPFGESVMKAHDRQYFYRVFLDTHDKYFTFVDCCEETHGIQLCLPWAKWHKANNCVSRVLLEGSWQKARPRAFRTPPAASRACHVVLFFRGHHDSSRQTTLLPCVFEELTTRIKHPFP